MTYDVVILASDESREQVRKAIDSIVKQSVKPDDIILVSDKRELLNAVNVSTVYQSEGGIGEARRLGYNEADAEWILFTDADTIMPTDFVSRALAYANEEGLDAVGGKIKPVGGTPLGIVFSAVTNLADFGKGHSTLIRSDIDFSKVNGGRSEDSDIWSQARNGSLMDFPRVETAITKNHKTLAVLIFLGIIYWIN